MLSHEELTRRAAAIRLLLLDVDGVLTDGKLIYSDADTESKNFHTQDGQGLALLRDHGVALGIVSGRKSKAVERRAAELKFAHVHLGVHDKWAITQGILAATGVAASEVCFVGDDLPDLAVMLRVGLACCPADAAADVASRAHWQTPRPGGAGAVRDVCELLLRAQGRWADAVARFMPAGGRA
jgi:3-deoxy-D-manno-octulosonate 8-phosphate phosphatase (KDO 8-P phosphatase)